MAKVPDPKTTRKMGKKRRTYKKSTRSDGHVTKSAWQPGESGNPLGKTKRRDASPTLYIREMGGMDEKEIATFWSDKSAPAAQRVASKFWLMALREKGVGDREIGDKAYIDVLNAILDRVSGKPVQSVEVAQKDTRSVDERMKDIVEQVRVVVPGDDGTRLISSPERSDEPGEAEGTA